MSCEQITVSRFLVVLLVALLAPPVCGVAVCVLLLGTAVVSVDGVGVVVGAGVLMII
jgi:hypothetical protein